MTRQQHQRFRHGDTIEKVCVRVTKDLANNETSSCYVRLDDIRDVFPHAIRFKLDDGPVPFMVGPEEKRIEPLRIAFYPDDILDVITDSPQSINTSAVVLSPTIRELYMQPSQHLLSSSPELLQSINSSLIAGQVPVSKSDFALMAIEKHMAVSNENSQEMRDMQIQIKTLLQEAKENNERMMALQLEAKEKDDKMALMQNQMLELQNQAIDLQNKALDRLAILQKHAHAILVQNFELHEYPIPRLFIILPVDKNKWDPTRVLENKFRLHFLCECGDHTIEASKSKENQIHIAKHDGYEIKDGIKFFKKYGKYMLILMRVLKLGMKSVDISVPHVPVKKLVEAGIDSSIEYIEALSADNPVLDNINTIDDYEALEGADLRQLDTFLRINDQERRLGNLYRTKTETGHVRWVCFEHYRLTYREKEQKIFAEIVEVNGGDYDFQLGKVVISLGSRIIAQEFFNALAKARHVYDLDVTFNWKCSTSDLSAFEKAFRTSSISILRLDLQQFQASITRKLLPVSTHYETIAHIIGHANMRIVHIILSRDFIRLSNLHPRSSSHLQMLSLGMNATPISASDFRVLVNSLKIDSILTTLDLQNNSLGNRGAVALSEALKTNTVLVALDLRNNLIETEGTVALTEALKINTTLTTLDLRRNPVGRLGALALSDVLETNTTLTSLNLWFNSIGKTASLAISSALKTDTNLTILNLVGNSIGNEGSMALSKALYTNSTLAILYLQNNSIEQEGAIALSEALKVNTTLTTLDLRRNPIGRRGALALAEALEINTTLTSLNMWFNSIGVKSSLALSEVLRSKNTLMSFSLKDNFIGNEGVIALSEALKTNTTLTFLHLNNNSIGKEEAMALSEILKDNTTLTVLSLDNNSIGNEGAMALSEALKDNTTLTQLGLNNNSIGNEGAIALSEALKGNTT
ncbi:hypothetical protein BGZ46_002072, partial [Entomortierella lignicola]